MPQQLSTYAPHRVSMTLGTITVNGFVDGTMISASREVPTFTKRTGADGEVIRSLMQNKSGTVNFTLMASSDANALLSAQQIADEESGAGVLPLLVKDNNADTDLISSPFAWIVGPADYEKALEAGEVPWILDCSFLTIVHGGLKHHT